LNANSKIFIAGKNGMVGSAIYRTLLSMGYNNILGPTSTELNLCNQEQTSQWFAKEMPEYVFLTAAKVGGILANNEQKAEFLYENLMIQTNVIHSSYKYGVKKLLFMGSSCVYPKMAPQPIKEEYLLTGLLEPTNEPYAIAKIAGIKMCDSYRYQYGCNFISTMPTNLYGPNDNYNLTTSHVIPALIKKMVDAKNNHISKVEIWGTGTPLREFLHVDDLAKASVLLMEKYSSSGIINIGSGHEVTIAQLAELIKEVVGYKGYLYFDTSKPDGTPRKFLDSSKIISLGWSPSITLYDGIKELYLNYFLGK